MGSRPAWLANERQHHVREVCGGLGWALTRPTLLRRSCRVSRSVQDARRYGYLIATYLTLHLDSEDFDETLVAPDIR